MRVTNYPASRKRLESRIPKRVKVPYTKVVLALKKFLSRSGHVEPRLNLRGPSRKAKYYLTTDSELSMVTER